VAPPSCAPPPPSCVPLSAGGAPPSPGLHSMTGRVGACGIGPHISPAAHSAAVAHSWMGPMGVMGQGAGAQLVVIMMVAQQTMPPVQPAEFVHVAPPLPLPLLLLVLLLLVEEPPEELVDVSSGAPESPVGVPDELLQPDAIATPMEPALSAVTKRILEICMETFLLRRYSEPARPTLGSRDKLHTVVTYGAQPTFLPRQVKEHGPARPPAKVCPGFAQAGSESEGAIKSASRGKKASPSRDASDDRSSLERSAAGGRVARLGSVAATLGSAVARRGEACSARLGLQQAGTHRPSGTVDC